MSGIEALASSVWQTGPTAQLTSQAGDAFGYGLSKVLGLQKAREQDQLRQQQKLTDIQKNANSELMKESYENQFDLWNKTGAPAQVALLKEAGLNPALMYAKGGTGGSTGGGGASVGGGTASDVAAATNAATNKQMAGLAMMRAKSEIAVNEATANKLNAEAQTTEESRSPLVEKLRQEGHGQWLENIRMEYIMGDDGNVIHKNRATGKEAGVMETSLFSRQIATDIAKAEAEKGNAQASALLTNEKAQGYWQELLNETMKADAAATQAAAEKLAKEWNTGEFTNWKTWVDLGATVVDDIIKGVGVSKLGGVKVTK